MQITFKGNLFLKDIIWSVIIMCFLSFGNHESNFSHNRYKSFAKKFCGVPMSRFDVQVRI